MGLLILERKELDSKYEQIKASTETVEIMRKRDQAVHLSALAEARRREDSLKKSVVVKDECIASVSLSIVAIFKLQKLSFSYDSIIIIYLILGFIW
jgi:disulfide oxidoreductase YuzD